MVQFIWGFSTATAFWWILIALINLKAYYSQRKRDRTELERITRQ